MDLHPQQEALEKAVRAGPPEQWNIKDGDTLVSVLVVPLPDVDQAIVHSPLIRYSPILINTKHAAYAKNMGELTEMISTSQEGFIDGTHLTFMWLWMFEKGVLDLKRDNGPVMTTFITVDVRPWRLALAEGIDDTIKRRLMLTHKLPFLRGNLEFTEYVLMDDLAKFAATYGHQETPHVDVQAQRITDLKREIKEAEAELAGPKTVGKD